MVVTITALLLGLFLGLWGSLGLQQFKMGRKEVMEREKITITEPERGEGNRKWDINSREHFIKMTHEEMAVTLEQVVAESLNIKGVVKADPYFDNYGRHLGYTFAWDRKDRK